MNKYISIIIVLTLLSCNSNDRQTINSPKVNIVELKQKVFLGDVKAYNDLKKIYLDSSGEEFLFWAIFMGNKYSFAQANLDAFNIIINTYINGNIDKFKELDIETQKLALFHLQKSAKNGNSEAKEIHQQIKKESLAPR